MKITLKPATPKPDPKPVEMTDDERAALEAEKAELVAQLQARVPHKATAAEPEEPERQPAEPEAPTPPAKENAVAQAPAPAPIAIDLPAATAEREKLQRDIAALQAQLVAAQKKEKLAQQQAVVAQQQAQQREGASRLAPLKPKLAHHLAEVSRIQTLYGPSLKEAARSLASGFDVQQRERKAEAYRAAQPLGARLGDARATIESAAKGVEQAMQSSHVHVHEQSKTLAEAALSINLLALERDCASLVQLIRELNPDFRVGYIAPDHMPPAYEPQLRATTADLGRSII